MKEDDLTRRTAVKIAAGGLAAMSVPGILSVEKSENCWIDGTDVGDADFKIACQKDRVLRAVISNERIGSHAFTSHEKYDQFMREHKDFSGHYERLLEKRERVSAFRDAVDVRRLASILRHAKGVLSTTEALIADLVEHLIPEGRDVPKHEDAAAFLADLLGPKMSTVYFFLGSNYTGAVLQPFTAFHVSLPNLFDFNNRISSVEISFSMFALSDGACWTGASRELFFPTETNVRRRLSDYGFNNRAESCFFLM